MYVWRKEDIRYIWSTVGSIYLLRVPAWPVNLLVIVHGVLFLYIHWYGLSGWSSVKSAFSWSWLYENELNRYSIWLVIIFTSLRRDSFISSLLVCLSTSSIGDASGARPVFSSEVVVRCTTPRRHVSRAHSTTLIIISVFTAFSLRKPLAVGNLSRYTL